MRDQTRTTEGNEMKAVAFLVRLLAYVNERLLLVGRGVGIAAVAVMVVVTILQVFCRYVLDNALAWPDEAARFCMLWMAGLMAPTAYRRGGFVAIDTIPALMPRRLAEVLSLVLLTLSLVVLVGGKDMDRVVPRLDEMVEAAGMPPRRPEHQRGRQ